MSKIDSLYNLIIADDEYAIRHGLTHYVDWKAMGFQVVSVFEDGKEVIEFLKSSGADVVLTDIKMSQISGLELAEYIYNYHPETSILIMSGYKEFEYAKKAIAFNVKEYLLKPVEIDKLKNIFQKLYVQISERKAYTRIRELLPFDNEAFIQLLLKTKPASNEDLESIINSLQEVDSGKKISHADYISSIISRSKVYMKENLSRDISLEDVADHIYLSPVYFSRFFKEKTGENFINFLTRIRMEEAKNLLDSHLYKIYEIGIMVGYQSSKYFTRVFKGMYGITPTEYLHR